LKKPLLVIFFTVFVDLIGFGIIIPLNAYLARHFGGDEFQVGLLMSIYSLMQFIFSPLWGRLSDRWGRRPVILISLLGAALSHLAFAFGSSYAALLIARCFAGIFGGNISAAMAFIADSTSEKDRSKGMGLIGAAFGLGFILGPALGGFAGHWGQLLGSNPPFGMSFSAVLASLICLVNFVSAYFILPESLSPEMRQKAREKKRRGRFEILKEGFNIPVVGPLMLVFFLSTLAMAFMEVSLFMFVADRLHWTLAQASFGFAYVGVIMVITQGYLIRKLLPLYGERRLMAAGVLLSALGIGGIAFCYNMWPLAVMVTLLGFGVGFTNPSINGSISLLTSREGQGGVMGVNQSLSALGRILGPALGGLFYRSWGSGSPFLVGGVCMIVALIFILRLYPRLPSMAGA
jgi:multidrug resistance protein